MLPTEFDHQNYLSIAQKLKIPAKTTGQQIGRFAKTGLVSHNANDKKKKY